jgi:hypothetical protein
LKKTKEPEYRKDIEFYKKVKFRVVEKLGMFHIEVFTKPYHLDKEDWYALDDNGYLVVEVRNYPRMSTSRRFFYTSLEDAKKFITKLRAEIIYHYID